MIQNARSYATSFDSEEKVRNKIADLRQQYKGISNWDIEIVSKDKTHRPDWELLKQAKIPVNQVWKPIKKGDEYVVRWTTNGKTDENKTYYTDDKDDANSTYAMMLKNAEELNKKGI